MSHKRHRDETSEQVNTHHKRLKDDHGVPHRVDPMRFDKSTPNNNNCEGWVENQTFAFGSDGVSVSMHHDPFAMPLPDDENENDNKMKMGIHNTNDNDTEFGLLLYELASLNVGNNRHSHDNNNNNHSNGNGNVDGGSKDNEQQTCPICSGRISLAEFPDHVHTCLDRMDAGDRNDMRTQLERDSDFAARYALNHGYVTDYGITCPICNKQCPLGTGINEHINQCIDEQEAKMDDEDDDDEDDDININSNNNNNNNVNVKKVAPLSREQMISCASKLMTLQQGSQQFDNMLDMFGALGFNKANVKSVLDIEKKQSNNNHNHKMNPEQQQQQQEEEEEEDNTTLSPIAEEDVDLFGQIKNKNNNNNNCNNFANSNDINQGFGQYTFDDDDL